MILTPAAAGEPGVLERAPMRGSPARIKSGDAFAPGEVRMSGCEVDGGHASATVDKLRMSGADCDCVTGGLPGRFIEVDAGAGAPPSVDIVEPLVLLPSVVRGAGW